jgi:hypothetical protein
LGAQYGEFRSTPSPQLLKDLGLGAWIRSEKVSLFGTKIFRPFRCSFTSSSGTVAAGGSIVPDRTPSMYALAAWVPSSTRRACTRVATDRAITGAIAVIKMVTIMIASKHSTIVKPD